MSRSELQPRRRGPSWNAQNAVERWERFWANKPVTLQRRILRHLAINVPAAFNALPPEIRALSLAAHPIDRDRLVSALERPDLDQRERAILAARANGVSLAQIAQRLGISRQRVHQIQASLIA